MSNFRQIDRETGFLLPPSVDEWLPERHLARFIVEVIAGLDLRSMSGSYRGSGSASYHPEVLLGACPNSRCSILSESDSTLGHEQIFSPLEYRSAIASAAECAGLCAERPCFAVYC